MPIPPVICVREGNWRAATNSKRMGRAPTSRPRAAMSLAALATAIGMLTPAGHAVAQAHSCPEQVSDPRGDAHDWMLPTKPYFAEGDVLGLRVSKTGSSLAFTWRLASVRSPPIRAINLLAIFDVGQGHSYAVSATHGADGDSYQDEQWDQENHIGVTGTLHNITGNYDAKAGTITTLVPMSDLRAHKYSAINDIYGFAAEQVGASAADVGEDVDDYSSAKTYYVGRNNC
jgi:hypothetical protein